MTTTLQVRIEGNSGRQVPRRHVTRRMEHVLSRVPLAPAIAHVTFSDVNGPQGGADVRCAVLVKLPHHVAIRCERVASAARLAFDETCDRIVRQLERSRERWLDSRRRPKKYYLAKRLREGTNERAHFH